mmetsp:Transcript_15120/g.33363  ORF Transcript_15120/g.33363 Transcript_15120/m.33363 type:complete len:263 (-) Transcript_15120:87-875(-)
MTVDLVVDCWWKSGSSETISYVPPHGRLQHLGLDRTHSSQQRIGITPVVESDEVPQSLEHPVVRGGAEGPLDPGSSRVLVLRLLRSPARSCRSTGAGIHDWLRAYSGNIVPEGALDLNGCDVRNCDGLHLDNSLEHINIMGFSCSPESLDQRCAEMIKATVGCTHKFLSAVERKSVLQLALHQLQIPVPQAFSHPARGGRRLGLAEGLNLGLPGVHPLCQTAPHGPLDGHRCQVQRGYRQLPWASNQASDPACGLLLEVLAP